VSRRAALVVLLLVASALGCGARAAGPREVVLAYFRFLAGDPIRTLPLLTPEFHRRHALRVATAADARAVADHRAPDEPPAAIALDRHQLGWLALVARPELEQRVAHLAIELGAATENGDAASVAVRVAPPGQPPFEQRFALVRAGAGAPWRIDAIEQSGVVDATALDAFAAHPTEAARRALAERRAP